MAPFGGKAYRLKKKVDGSGPNRKQCGEYVHVDWPQCKVDTRNRERSGVGYAGELLLLNSRALLDYYQKRKQGNAGLAANHSFYIGRPPPT